MTYDDLMNEINLALITAAPDASQVGVVISDQELIMNLLKEGKITDFFGWSNASDIKNHYQLTNQGYVFEFNAEEYDRPYIDLIYPSEWNKELNKTFHDSYYFKRNNS